MTAKTGWVRGLVCVAAGALVLGACGGDDDSRATTDAPTTTTAPDATAQPYVDALADELAEPTDEGDIALTGAESECLAVAIVDAADADFLDEEGISPYEFAAADSLSDVDVAVDADTRAALETAAVECTDMGRLLAAGFAEEVEFDAGCLAEQVDEEAFAPIFVDQIVLGDDAEEPDDAELARLVFESADDACLEDLFVQSIASAGEITDAQADCIAGELDDGVAREAFLAFADDAEPSAATTAALEDAVEACVGA
ncbi:MAG TPA: hypothetical protein VFZ83_09340 [Acidimicrobiia bacterium]|nr:hypothetical protein [Acidimicrobiia bacterium]